MQSSSQTDEPDFWLEPLDTEKHFQDFHEICADEQAALWSSQPHTDTVDSTKERISKAIVGNACKPWLLNCAVMSSNYSPPGSSEPTRKMVGVVRTTRATPWGLSVGYKLRSDCWGKGYATRAVGMFLDVYWSQVRMAPRGEVYIPEQLKTSDKTAAAATDTVLGGAATEKGETTAPVNGKPDGDDYDEEVEITHLVAQVDPENTGSMRVAEKCGGKLVTVSRRSVKVWRFPEMRDMAVWRLDKPSDVARSA